MIGNVDSDYCLGFSDDNISASSGCKHLTGRILTRKCQMDYEKYCRCSTWPAQPQCIRKLGTGFSDSGNKFSYQTRLN